MCGRSGFVQFLVAKEFTQTAGAGFFFTAELQFLHQVCNVMKVSVAVWDFQKRAPYEESLEEDSGEPSGYILITHGGGASMIV